MDSSIWIATWRQGISNKHDVKRKSDDLRSFLAGIVWWVCVIRDLPPIGFVCVGMFCEAPLSVIKCRLKIPRMNWAWWCRSMVGTTVWAHKGQLDVHSRACILLSFFPLRPSAFETSFTQPLWSPTNQGATFPTEKIHRTWPLPFLPTFSSSSAQFLYWIRDFSFVSRTTC